MGLYEQAKTMSMKHAYKNKHLAAKDKAKARRSKLNSTSPRVSEDAQVSDEVQDQTKEVRYGLLKKLAT